MKTAWDFIVIGCGGLGSAATYWLSRIAGKEVLAIEQFHVGHDNGASQDHSRIIRLSYHAPEYTALTPHTYTAWQEVEQESGVQLVVRCGGLDLAPESSAALDDYTSSMTAAGIPFESLSAAQAMERWPQLRLDPTDRALFQAEGGLVDARKAIQTHAALARAHGATILDRTPVRGIRPNGSGIEVLTDAGTFTAGNVVVTADAWTNQVLQGVGASYPLTITQEQVTYWATPYLRDFAPERFPIWIWHGGTGSYFYGFPVYGEVATKAGEDVGGQVVTPDSRTFERDERAHGNLTGFLERYIPGFLGPVLYTKTCLYTMTPDRNFVIERLPEEPRVAVALGAAHAFKFSCLIGQILADLATEGETRYPIAPFSSQRPAILDPDFVPSLNLVASHGGSG
jgi:sarcosine oxidase